MDQREIDREASDSGPSGRMARYDHVVYFPGRRTQPSMVVAPDFASISSRGVTRLAEHEIIVPLPPTIEVMLR